MAGLSACRGEIDWESEIVQNFGCCYVKMYLPPPKKITCALKNSGWKMKVPFEMPPFYGGARTFCERMFSRQEGDDTLYWLGTRDPYVGLF